MTKLNTSRTSGLVVIIVAILAAGSAFADKPSKAGGGKHEKKQHKEGQKDRNNRQGNYDNRLYHDKVKPNFSGDRYFIDRHQTVIRDYYVNEYKTNHCPPGLAKKRNGCMPPGQAKKWAIGRPLPRDVVYYALPTALAITMGPPPPGYRFVRVASDILMITIGTGMVMDAVNDLGRY